MAKWEVFVTVNELGSRAGIRKWMLTTTFDAENLEEGKAKTLKWLRGRTKRLVHKKSRWVHLQAGPLLKDGEGDLQGLVRIRHKYNSLAEIRRVGPEKLFVVGYGPEAAKELAK